MASISKVQTRHFGQWFVLSMMFECSVRQTWQKHRE